MTQPLIVNPLPQITAIPWLPAKEVLGGEASDFTPWLQRPESLEILGAALKLDELAAISTEHNVLGKRLDILASALDEDGEEIAVCIENQYGMSDANHLGRLIAYLAQHERGRAVWVVEQAHDAYIAGVRFLNRTSTEDVGYYLVQVRFTTAAGGGYHVHFDVLAAPIAWESAGRRGGGGVKVINTNKVEYLEALYEQAQPSLHVAGFTGVKTHAHGSYLYLYWPQDLWFRPYGKRLDVRVTKNDVLVALYINGFTTKAANVAAAEVLREHLGDAIETVVPADTELDWDSVGSGKRKVVRLKLPGQGYEAGDPVVAAEWAASCCQGLLSVLAAQPIGTLMAEVESRSPGSRAVGGGAPDPDDPEIP